MLKLKEQGHSKTKSNQKLKLREKQRSGSRTSNKNEMVMSLEKVHKMGRQ